MKKIAGAVLLALMMSCDKPAFDIDPNKIYSPTELRQAAGKCGKQQPWENKTVRVAGRIGQTYLSETENGGKFWLHDEKTRDVIEVYVAGASVQEVAAIYQLVRQSFGITVTGKAVPDLIHTQLKCRKSLHLEITKQSDIKL